jgi:kinesin family protein 5
MKMCLGRGGTGNAFSGLDSSMSPVRHSQLKDLGNGRKASIATLFEQGKGGVCEN